MSGLGLAVVERVLWRRGDSVDGVVVRLVEKWRVWRRARNLGKNPPDQEMESSQVTVTTPLPRYRESLLDEFPPEAEARQERVQKKREGAKGWHWRRKRREDVSFSVTNSSYGNSSVASTSVGVADLDSGLATIGYSKHDD